MMPDKIYLNKYMLRKGMLYPAQPPADVPEKEYIRKDALLEWAKGEMMPGNSAEGKGWNWALQTLMDKIESL